jgi:hypothetical protein
MRVFYCSQRENFTAAQKNWSHVLLTFPEGVSPAEHTILLPTSLPNPEMSQSSNKATCKHYAVSTLCKTGSEILLV